MKHSYRIAPFAVVILLSVYYFCGVIIFVSLIIAAAIHELGHASTIWLCGGKVNRISFDASGMSICGTGIESFCGEIAVLLSGPTAGLLLTVICANSESKLLSSVGGISLLLSVYNLLPALPLDGGRVVSCVIGKLSGADIAERVMEFCGIIIGGALSIIGAVFMKAALLIAGIWILIAQSGIVKNMRVL